MYAACLSETAIKQPLAPNNPRQTRCCSRGGVQGERVMERGDLVAVICQNTAATATRGKCARADLERERERAKINGNSSVGIVTGTAAQLNTTSFPLRITFPPSLSLPLSISPLSLFGICVSRASFVKEC